MLVRARAGGHCLAFASTFRLERFNVLEAIDDTADNLQVTRAEPQPAPALKRARADAPPTR